MAPARRTGPGPLETSSGTAVGVRSHIGLQACHDFDDFVDWGVRIAPFGMDITADYLRSRLFPCR
eukprot:5070398-Karenia_brevis.AAC.1